MCLLSVTKNHRNPIKGPIIAWKIVEVISGKVFTPFQQFRITKKWKSAWKGYLAANDSCCTRYKSGFHCYTTQQDAAKARVLYMYMKTKKVIPVQIDEITTTGIDGTTYEIKQAMLKNYVAQKIRLMPQPAKKKKNKLKRG
jgi:hypothetical protein